ncbi:Exodeoxyribonuclease VII large subunit (EC [Olavius algarvensis Delta 1 endosymbiont]|nr:Exodeoxyribonuclease VII large subunit (EC [Olavius algarvensis Delta 1 endosymbiont]
MFENHFHNPDDGSNGPRNIYSVSQLNAEIKILIEESFPFVWIFGEISNFRVPASGHYYFSLKDSKSQISAVMFRGQQRRLTFKPEDGMSVTGMGRLGVYEPRGSYQIILEYLEPSGIGALQIAFEKLKKRLAAEGCFDDALKKPIPVLPKLISVITSPTGAVIHDIIHTISRRFANCHIQIIPTKVQGSGAAEEICAALELLNDRNEAEVAILARGGGSLEDLQAFNTESVARAILASRIPVISAIGHETDYTIADFTADLRAATPTAAAELVVPEKRILQRRCSDLLKRIETKYLHYFNDLNLRHTAVSKRLIDPRRKLEDFRLRLDDLGERIHRTLARQFHRKQEHLDLWQDRLMANTPRHLLGKANKQLEQINQKLIKSLIISNHSKQINLRELTATLEALNPLAILARGYSITRTIPDKAVVKNERDVVLDQALEVMLAKGRLVCRVEGKTSNGQKDF